MEWQERIVQDTAPSIRIEHQLRYALAVPLIAAARTWLDLGCGAGVGAAAALGDRGPERAVLVDASASALAEAQHLVPAGETVALEADLAARAGLDAVREALEDARDGVVTCFEVIEHLEQFTGVVELMVELADQRGFTGLLSVPNDAFWPIESPWHATMWGEGAFEELRRLLPADHVIAQQVPLQGSAILIGEDAGIEPGGASALPDGVPSHFIAAIGPQRRAIAGCAAMIQADLSEQRRWERQREANLAFYEDRIVFAQREFLAWRAYINQLEIELGREPTTTPLDFP